MHSIAIPPLLFFRDAKPELGKTPSSKTEPNDQSTQQPSKILCAVCQHDITNREYATDINGQHQHTFTNPAQVTYDIACYTQADGCQNHGIPTDEFTWFPGFSWRYALCSNCHSHLGWYYQMGRFTTFYGLIIQNLREQ